MTLEQLMKERGGLWDNGSAIIQGEGGYYIRIAEGTPEKYTITRDGKPFFPEVLDKPKTVVESAPKKRRKSAVDELADELDL